MPEEKKAESLTAHDSTIREPLFDFLEEKYGKIRIIEEKTIGRVRADVVMVTPDALFGIEIKKEQGLCTGHDSRLGAGGCSVEAGFRGTL